MAIGLQQNYEAKYAFQRAKTNNATEKQSYPVFPNNLTFQVRFARFFLNFQIKSYCINSLQSSKPPSCFHMAPRTLAFK